MFGLTQKKTDTTFGPPYAVFNLSKIGLRYFRIGIEASAHSRDKLVAHAAAHPNVGWIFSAEGWFNLAIGFWARDNAEINDISAQIRAVLSPQDKIVFQSELTSLYSFGNKGVRTRSPMCVVDAAMQPVELTTLEVDYIKLIALDSSQSPAVLSEILAISEAEVSDLKVNLEAKGVLLGYQDRIDYGGVYYKVFVDTLSRKKPDAYAALIQKIWSAPDCLYFERANGKYDLEFEVVLESKSAIKEYVKDFSDYKISILTQNLYTNLFPLNKTANLKEVRDAFSRQEGNTVDLRDSKLWYLNHQGAEAYLNIYENRKYFEAMSKSELDLFADTTAHIRAAHPESSFSLIDIGSGDGLKSRIFIEKLGEERVKAYFPVDIQPIELAAALRAHEEGTYAKHPTLLDIEKMPARFPLALVPGERQTYVFFGGTYGNYPASVINSHLKKLLGDTTTLVISMPILREHKTDAEIEDSYSGLAMETVSFGALAQIGFMKEHFERNLRHPEFILQPKMEGDRLVISYVLKEDVLVLDKKFEKGTVFKTTTSWKPTFEQFKEAIEQDFKAQFFRNTEFAIAVIEEAK